MTIQSISDELFLMETLDGESMVSHTVDHADMHDVKNIKEHVLNDGTSFYTFSKDGYTEIHHATPDNVSGVKLQGNNPMNLKWVTTAYKIAHPLIENGHIVKISGTTDVSNGHNTSLFGNYLKFTNTIARRRNYSVSNPVYSTDDQGRNIGTVVVAKAGIGVMGQAQRKIVESMNEQNGYTGITMIQGIISALSTK
jgi:hypothetical protein